MSKKPRPELLTGKTYAVKTDCGKIYITLNYEGDNLFEVFLNMGKAGGCASSQSEAIGRLISYALRIGGDIEEISKELIGIHCHNGNGNVSSCADAVARVLKGVIENK